MYLISLAVALLCGILESLNGGIEAVSLPLQALHLLTDGVHGVAWILSATGNIEVSIDSSRHLGAGTEYHSRQLDLQSKAGLSTGEFRSCLSDFECLYYRAVVSQ